mmetsp:Transcript_443/g.472  ORF Transcript_443/g.472 Transcript_443/m.472 type:complete len:127 (-) Transcript_443:7-387(-)
MDNMDEDLEREGRKNDFEEDKYSLSKQNKRQDVYESNGQFEQSTDLDHKDFKNKDSFFGEVGVFVRHPEFPTKSIALSIFLSLLGIVLIICGFVSEINSIDPSRGVCFWVIGAIVSIPGFYFTYKL